MVYTWCAVLIVMIVIECATTALTTIWFAGGALIALVLCLLHVSAGVQVAAFVLISVVLLILTRPFAQKFVNRGLTLTNADALVGLDGVATSAIDNIRGLGGVQIRGQEWSARSSKDEVVIPKDTIVTVKAISGVKLIVEEKDSHSHANDGKGEEI